MASKVTPKTAIAFTKVIIALSFTWPLSKSASKFQVIRFKILRSLLCVNAVILIVPVSYTLYHNDYDLPKITKLWCLLGAFIQIPLEITQCALQYDRLQYLISEMEHNFECAKPYEEMLYQRYVDRCAMFYASSTAAVFLGACIAIIVPLIAANQIFPTDAKYPFDVEREPVKTIIFLHQFVAIWQCFSIVCLCSFVGLLIWFAAARFEILSQQFRTVTDIYGITVCVRQHVKLLRYAQEVIIAFRSVILSIIIICTWAIVASGLTIVSQSTLTDKVQFMTLCIAGLMEVYACAWPADHLIDTSTNVARAIYDSLWYNQDKAFQKNLCFILLRSQTPTTISVSFLPALSLQYYASYVSTVFSYLMTLRMIFVVDSGVKNYVKAPLNLINLVNERLYNTFIQTIICEMEDYIEKAKLEEKNIFQRYINKSKLFYATTMCWITVTEIIVVFGPLLLSQPFPLGVEYPFDVNKQPLKTIIYLHHAMVIYQVGAQVCGNIFVALLLWFVAARFEILSQKFQKITSISELIICVQLHQRLLRYAKDVIMTVRYIALSTIGFSTIAVVFSGLTILSRQPLTVKAQFFGVSAIALVEVFICAWPADYLLRTSNDVGHAGYESSWYSKEVSLQKNLLYVVSRCQHPVTLTVPCLLPALSLNYYASYLSTTFSYLTTFRAIFAVEEDGLQM
ncbi:uncharacterized protein [Temnothorax nylanderi]|uniref:uncharacterized protein n=1 Tax=Temnothorax nylanderi TaxID=102681 RepID=UPI003A843345